MQRDEVFTAGGQPTVTYVQREHDEIERNFRRAIATPNQIVSLSGPTKTGKTVLCRHILRDKQFVWIDGGLVADANDFWDRVASELNIPSQEETQTGTQTEVGIEGSIPLVTTASGSQLFSRNKSETRRIDSMSGALSALVENRIHLVIDDFHYIPEDDRTLIMRNVKGAVFNSLKVILLSVTHRVFEAAKAEPELTGRFTAISLPEWSKDDLRSIASQGFEALQVDCPQMVLQRLLDEAQESPFLMQKFCWEICFDLEIEKAKLIGRHKIPAEYSLEEMFPRLAQDAGLPVYQKLAAGPQSRKIREKRPLKNGGAVDIYQAVLLAIAETGPKSVISYDNLRNTLSALLISEKMPQKHEVTSALKHLSKISKETGSGNAIDWDEDNREIYITDPYLRFFLRWQVRGGPDSGSIPLTNT